MRQIALLSAFGLSLVVASSNLAAFAQQIESELIVITPVGKTITDPALSDFSRYAKEKWGVALKVSAIAAGTPVAYGQILEWNGRPKADLFWGGESILFDRLRERGLLLPHRLSTSTLAAIPESIGRPKAIQLKDPKGHWVGTLLEAYGLVYHPKVLERLGMAPLKDWNDLLDPRLKGQVVQCAPTMSGSSHGAYELILQREGDEQGWKYLRKLAANTGHFAARSRDVPSLVAKGEFAVGFAVPSYMAFEDHLAGFDLKFVAPTATGVTIGTIGVLSGAAHPNAARLFIEFMLSERGQRVAMQRGVFPIVSHMRMEGTPGSTIEAAVAFMGGLRSYYDREFANFYDDDIAERRYEETNIRFRREIETVWPTLKAQ
jgi:iron(III) transport system substrate-binding protein